MKKLVINNDVRKLRFQNDEMTQKDLALKVGVSRQTIVAIEKGKYSPTLELCFKISLAFDKPIDEIFYIDSTEENMKWRD